MAQRNRNDFDSTGNGSDADDAVSNNAGRDVQADGDASASTAGGSATAELERKLAEAQDKYLRQAAEYDNYRKRMIKERTEMVPRAQADLVRQLLDPLDDLARFAH